MSPPHDMILEVDPHKRQHGKLMPEMSTHIISVTGSVAAIKAPEACHDAMQR
jgi:hypothetical protein